MKTLLIAFEGIDSSGKRTQTALLLQALNSMGLTAEEESFPRYGTFFGRESARS